ETCGISLGIDCGAPPSATRSSEASLARSAATSSETYRRIPGAGEVNARPSIPTVILATKFRMLNAECRHWREASASVGRTPHQASSEFCILNSALCDLHIEPSDRTLKACADFADAVLDLAVDRRAAQHHLVDRIAVHRLIELFDRSTHGNSADTARGLHGIVIDECHRVHLPRRIGAHLAH